MYLTGIKEFINSNLVFAGQVIKNFFTVIRLIVETKIDRRELITHSVKVAFDTLPIVFMTTLAIGVVVGVQLAPEFASRGVGNNIGIVTTIAMLREVAPIIGTLMIATQYGAGIAAEIANMKITEQIDAIKVLHVDPIEYLVVPRFLAAVFLVPFVVFMSAIVGVISTYITSYFKEQIYLHGYIRSIWDTLETKDIFICLMKAAIFGGVIVLLSSSIGLSASGGAKEVGKATTRSVVICFVVVVLLDYIISSIYL